MCGLATVVKTIVSSIWGLLVKSPSHCCLYTVITPGVKQVTHVQRYQHEGARTIQDNFAFVYVPRLKVYRKAFAFALVLLGKSFIT